MKINRDIKVKIDNAIDIDVELNKICVDNNFHKQFGLKTGYLLKDKIIKLKDLKISKQEKHLLKFLQITEVLGASSMEYDEFIFKGKSNSYTSNNITY